MTRGSRIACRRSSCETQADPQEEIQKLVAGAGARVLGVLLSGCFHLQTIITGWIHPSRLTPESESDAQPSPLMQPRSSFSLDAFNFPSYASRQGSLRKRGEEGRRRDETRVRKQARVQETGNDMNLYNSSSASALAPASCAATALLLPSQADGKH